MQSTRDALLDLEGAYALGVISNHEPDRMIAARRGSPLVIGLGIGENFIASDVAALLPVTRRFIFLEEGDVADIRRDSIVIYDDKGEQIERPEVESALTPMRWIEVSIATTCSKRFTNSRRLLPKPLRDA